jgi:hypothetical protein
VNGNRDWSAAIRKCVTEGECRVCRAGSPDPAHVVGREHDPTWRGDKQRRVLADSIVPLCRDCHTAYDEHRLPILSRLYAAEIAQAVRDVGLRPMLVRTLAVNREQTLLDRLAAYISHAEGVIP